VAGEVSRKSYDFSEVKIFRICQRRKIEEFFRIFGERCLLLSKIRKEKPELSGQ